MEKQILEVTSSFVKPDAGMKGLTTTLAFSGGIIVKRISLQSSNREKLCHEVSIVSNNIGMGPGEPDMYETMAFTDAHKSSVYCDRVEKEEEMASMHFRASEHFKKMYLEQKEIKSPNSKP